MAASGFKKIENVMFLHGNFVVRKLEDRKESVQKTKKIAKCQVEQNLQ